MIRKGALKSMKITNIGWIWMYNTLVRDAPRAPQQPESKNLKEFGYKIPPAPQTWALLYVILASTQYNNSKIHQISAKVNFIFEHLESTEVLVPLRLLNDDDDNNS